MGQFFLISEGYPGVEALLSMLKFVLVLLVACVLPSASAELSGKRPNIIFVLTDDQGYGDLSAHGNPVLKTPNLDRLHSESVRFTDFMVSPTCAPTRCALLTGRHEFRSGVTHTVLERERMDLKAVTVAQVLQNSGYSTGIFGKWHLGDEKEYRPIHRGFDEQFIHGGGGLGQSYPGSCGDAPGNGYFDPVILHKERFVKTQGYCTDVFFQQALAWMESVKGKKPFYCHLATNAPHAPYVAKPEDKKLYEGRGLSEDAESFFGMIHNIDLNVGKLLKKLDEWGIAKDTLVVFMNDNGGTGGVKVYNAQMRGAKGSPWLGGTRAMSFWRWPETLKPADCTALTAHVDVFRTWAALAGAELDERTDKQVEGRSLIPLLQMPDALWPERTLFTHNGRWKKGASYLPAKARNASVRTTRYHLVSEAPRGPGGLVVDTFKPRWQLFDVKADPSEKNDIAAQHPDLVKQMLGELDAWWGSLAGQADLHEAALGPRLNPFAEEYWAQFGGGPTAADLKRMDPQAAYRFVDKKEARKK